MRFDLAAMTRRARNPRRASITLRPISPPATRATDLFRSAYLPIITAWQGAIEPIMAEYERTLAQMPVYADAGSDAARVFASRAMTQDSPASVQAEIERVEDGLQGVLLTLATRIERWAALAEAWHRARWRGAVLTATSVDLRTMIGPADVRETVETVIQRNVGLVRSVSDETRRRIGDAVFRGLQNRTPAREVAAELREAVAMSRRRALNIAADQNVKLASALNEERRRQAGILAWAWVHSGKVHARPEHEARNGFLYSEDPAKVGDEYQGKRIRKPPEDKPGELPYCGCTSRAVLIL